MKVSVKVSSRSDIWNHVNTDYTCPPGFLLDSRRTWIFLMDNEMVSDGREHPSEASVKVSSRSNLFWLS